MEEIIYKYRHWRFKNTFFLIVSVAVFFYFADTPLVKELIAHIGNYRYLGAFLAGMFFVSTFTIAPASVVLFYLARIYHPLEIALLAGLGGVFGDYVIFHFLKDKVFEELKPIFFKLGGSHLSRTLSTPYFAWFAPVFGALIIISPFPDELGLGLLGISRLKNWQFILISLCLNFIGMFLIAMLARTV